MSIEITDLTALDADKVTASLTQTVQMVREAVPTLDARRGVLHDLLLYPGALLDSQLRAGVVDRYLSARSLLDIQADPTLADEEVVDRVLSNYRLERGDGSSAVGQVTIVLSRPTSYTVASGAVFTANGKQFTSDAAYTAKPEASQINGPTDRLLTTLDDGNYAFTIDVTAAEPGTASLVSRNTLVVPSALPGGYVTSYAANDFTGGLDAESNDELLTRLQQGIAAKATSNRVTMQAMLRADPDFARVVHSSIIGHGDGEMVRDQHTIWPGSLGGRVDWYVRTVERAIRTTLTRTSTLLTINADGTGLWQFSLGRDDAPAFYEVVSILRPDAQNAVGSLPISEDVRGVNMTPRDDEDFVPDIQTVAEGAYTRYQTAVVRFTDTATDHTAKTVGDTAEYNVAISGIPQVADVQDYVGGRDNRSHGADVLVKAPVPCFVRIYFRVAKTSRQADPDIAAIADAVARAVNTTDFTGRLYAAALQDVIAGYLADGMSAGALDMFGRIRQPDGTLAYVRSSEVLVIDEVDGAMVSPRTVAFFLDPADVVISISTEIPLPT